jgi:hypothetical protein
MDEQRIKEIATRHEDRFIDGHDSCLADSIAAAIREALSSQEEELRKLRETPTEACTALALVNEMRRNGLVPEVIARAYGWAFTVDGDVHGLTAGDMGFEDSGIKIDAQHFESWRTQDEQIQRVERELAVKEEELRSLREERDGLRVTLREGTAFLQRSLDDARFDADAQCERAEKAEAALQRLREGLWLLPVYYAADLDGTLHRREDINSLLASPVEENQVARKDA